MKFVATYPVPFYGLLSSSDLVAGTPIFFRRQNSATMARTTTPMQTPYRTPTSIPSSFAKIISSLSDSSVEHWPTTPVRRKCGGSHRDGRKIRRHIIIFECLHDRMYRYAFGQYQQEMRTIGDVVFGTLFNRKLIHAAEILVGQPVAVDNNRASVIG